MILFDIYFNQDKLLKSDELFSTFKNEILSCLEIENDDLHFYLLNKKMAKISAHFFTNNGYIKASLDKKKGTVKKKHLLPYSEMNIKAEDSIGSGLSYKISYNDNGQKESFLFQFDFEASKLKDSNHMKRYLDTVKKAVSLSKDSDLRVPETDLVMKGEISAFSDNTLKLKESRMKKTLKDFEKAGKEFFNTTKTESLEDIIFCDRFKLLGVREYYLFLKDRIMILKGVSKKFDKSKGKNEFLYCDIDSVELGKDVVLNKVIDLKEILISFKSKTNEICKLYVNLEENFLKNETICFENDSLYFEKIFTALLKNSKLSIETSYNKSLVYISKSNAETILSKDFSLPFKELIIQLTLMPFYEDKLSEVQIKELLKSLDQMYLSSLKLIGDTLQKANMSRIVLDIKKQFADVVGGVNTAPVYRGIENIHLMNSVRKYIIKYSTQYTGIKVEPAKWNISCFNPLKEELKANRKVTLTYLSVARRTSLDIAARAKREKREQKCVDYIRQWCSEDLQEEIDRFSSVQY